VLDQVLELMAAPCIRPRCETFVALGKATDGMRSPSPEILNIVKHHGIVYRFRPPPK